jgi:hypothetical protein
MVQAIGTKGTLYREGNPPAAGKVVRVQDGRDNGDHLIEFANDGTSDPYTGIVTREWHVVRPHGVVENDTFELEA